MEAHIFTVSVAIIAVCQMLKIALKFWNKEDRPREIGWKEPGAPK